ncbi:3-oxoacyl-ACP reductase FabG [Dactylosporangium aurantiacum]|uniref:3-oxoacyl-ACP reductase FabG n=1 Tax=Dactylosporangium aurantiacum TaxID=35754 RepID=A0A9Q9MAA6_9ACTN|nr:3-oxoacyl-ACP reductase FabG [Dactylosporangium aurantiacum]MDG6105113.1 3-oxoacyl-ACP reductase FabG [Dactylosporangium aurantiacum]UWZ51638.1 3-oxoacyl-ACP reductase FabG [Dactylosporangium aurantiacum]
MFDLTGRRALVTGAGHGIGAAIAVALAEHGADVVVHYGHSAGRAAAVVDRIAALGRRAVALPADVTDTGQVDRLLAEATGHLGGLDVLVCNAGHLVGRVAVGEMSDEHFARVTDVNLTATFRTVRAALPALRAAGSGRIITMASLAAHNGGGPGAVAYAAAKAGVIGLTKGLAKELAPDRITVNALAPGYIGDTDFHATFSTPQRRAATVAALPVGRGGTAAEVAAAAVYLASAEAAFVTGTTLDVDGGAAPR